MRTNTPVISNNNPQQTQGWGIWFMLVFWFVALSNRGLYAEHLPSDLFPTTEFQLSDSISLQRQRDSLYQLIQEAQQKHATIDEIKLWNVLGSSFLQTHQHAAADSSWYHALQLIPDSLESLKAQLHLDMAFNYKNHLLFNLAEEHLELAGQLFQKNKNKMGEAMVLYEQSMIAQRLGDYTRAIGLMHQSMDLYQEMNDRAAMAQLSFDLGSILQKWKKYEVATKYFNDAYSYFSEKADMNNMLLTKIKLGQLALAEKKYTEAQIIFDGLLTSDSIRPNQHFKSLILMNLGDVYFHDGKMLKALNYYQQAETSAQSSNDQTDNIQALQHEGKLYMAMQEFQQAKKVAEASCALSEKMQNKEYLLSGWQMMADISYHLRDYSNAYDYLNRYTRLKDEMFSEEGNAMVNEFAVRYETDKIREAYQTLIKENELANTKLKRQQDTGSLTMIIAVFVILVSLIILIFIIIRNRESQRGYAVLSIKNKKISDQKEILTQLNIELTKSREQYRSIVENASVGMYQTTREGKIRFANAALKKMLRYPENLDISEINLSIEQPLRQKFIELLESQGVITGREDMWKRYDGSYMEVNESAWLVYDNESQGFIYEGVVEDISKRKEAELALTESQDKLRKMNSELVEKNKLIEKAKNEAVTANEIKSIFLANVSHEIRTPMNSIIGFSEILARNSVDEQQLYYINAIRSSSSNLLALLNDILDLSKIQSHEIKLIYEPVSIKKVTLDVKKIFQLKGGEKKLDLVWEFAPNFADRLNIDGVRMRQILINMVSNAIKFTEKGSVKVYFSTKSEGQNRCELQIKISDTGIGIAQEEYNTIFEAFKQSKFLGDKAYSGTGLGLSISKQLVENMGGRIQLESELNVGTTFTITIPHVEVVDNKADTETTENHSAPTLHLGEFSFENTNENSPVHLTLSEAEREKTVSALGWQWEKLNQSHLVPQLILFAQSLGEFATTEDLPALVALSTELQAACQRFDVDKIEFLLSGLKNIFVK